MQNSSNNSLSSQEQIDSYIKDVLAEDFPNLRAHTIVTTSDDQQVLDLKHYRDNSIFKDAPAYWIEPHGKKFIHYYSSIRDVLHIMNQRAIDLKSLSLQNDPQEMYEAGIITELDQQIPLFKELFHQYSFCEYDENTSPEQFEMWRLYGNDGRGAALIFEIPDENPGRWQGYHLLKVNYSNPESTGPTVLEKILARRSEWIKKYEYHIPEDYIFYLKIAAFHKKSLWKIENEFRLLHAFSNIAETWIEKRHLISGLDQSAKRGSSILFPFADRKYLHSEKTELYNSIPENDPIVKHLNNDIMKHIHTSSPKIIFTQVILGPRCVNNNVLQGTINDICLSHYNPQKKVTVKESIFREHFV